MGRDCGDQRAGQRPLQVLAHSLHDDLIAQIGRGHGGVQQHRAGNVVRDQRHLDALRIRAATITS